MKQQHALWGHKGRTVLMAMAVMASSAFLCAQADQLSSADLHQQTLYIDSQKISTQARSFQKLAIEVSSKTLELKKEVEDKKKPLEKKYEELSKKMTLAQGKANLAKEQQQLQKETVEFQTAMKEKEDKINAEIQSKSSLLLEKYKQAVKLVVDRWEKKGIKVAAVIDLGNTLYVKPALDITKDVMVVLDDMDRKDGEASAPALTSPGK